MARGMLCLLIALALMLGACGKKDEETRMEKAIEKETGGKAHVDLSKQKMMFPKIL